MTQNDDIAELKKLEERQRIIKLRISGVGIHDIARQCGLSATRVSAIITEALDERRELDRQTLENYRQLELERIDKAMSGIANLVDMGLLGATDRWIKLSERRAKLLNLDLDKGSQGDHTVEIKYVNNWRTMKDDDEAETEEEGL